MELTDRSSRRIQSIDLLRGAIMIVMAIDHVRVYSGLPAGGPTPGIFFTRWVTHFCAPGFVFLAGTSAYLYLQKTGNKSELAKFLLTRGLLLVVLELTFVRFFWMFNFDYATFTFAGVIWMLGWSMVILACFVRLTPKTLIVVGLTMIFLQQAFSYVPSIFPEILQPAIGTIYSIFYPSALVNKSGAALLSGISGFPSIAGISIFYVLIPWVGVMMAGFGFGQIFELDLARRRQLCLKVGIGCTALFLIAGSILILLKNKSDNETVFLFELLGQQKYPPSQLYLLMTIGPLIALIPWAEKQKGTFSNLLIIVGRVPMFYYLLHILLIHLSALVVNLTIDGQVHQEWYDTAPFVGIPGEDRWGLPTLYLVWAIDVVILFFACKWYANYKATHASQTWLKYL